jgi:hypothetical protein
LFYDLICIQENLRHSPCHSVGQVYASLTFAKNLLY